VEPTRLAQILAADLRAAKYVSRAFWFFLGRPQPKRSAARAGHGKPWVLQHPTMALVEGASSKKKGRMKTAILTFSLHRG